MIEFGLVLPFRFKRFTLDRKCVGFYNCDFIEDVDCTPGPHTNLSKISKRTTMDTVYAYSEGEGVRFDVYSKDILRGIFFLDQD